MNMKSTYQSSPVHRTGTILVTKRSLNFKRVSIFITHRLNSANITKKKKSKRGI